MLAERFGTPVEEFDPFKTVTWDQKLEARRRGSGRHGGGCRRPRAAAGGRPMIRVNLLGVERQKVKKPLLAFDPAQSLTVICSLILVATAAGLGWWFWSLQAGVDAARRGHRRGAAGIGAAPVAARRGPAVRGAADARSSSASR